METFFQLIHNLLGLIMFIFCPETVICFIIYPMAFDYMDAHTITLIRVFPNNHKVAV